MACGRCASVQAAAASGQTVTDLKRYNVATPCRNKEYKLNLCSCSRMPMFKQQGNMSRPNTKAGAPQLPPASAHQPTSLEAHMHMQGLRLDEPAPEPSIEEANSTGSSVGPAPRAQTASGNAAASAGSASSSVAAAASLTGGGTRGAEPASGRQPPGHKGDLPEVTADTPRCGQCGRPVHIDGWLLRCCKCCCWLHDECRWQCANCVDVFCGRCVRRHRCRTAQESQINDC